MQEQETEAILEISLYSNKLGARNGCRGYIAFAGGLDIPIVMGSKSTLLRNHLGGVKGRKLEKGDEIGFVSAKTILPNMEARKVPANVYPKKEIVLRVVLGPQDDEFTEAGVKSFFWNSGVITNEFDRMGCRLEGPFIAPKETSDIISDGIAFGAIQVPSHGKPIILLADRQTTGGYGKIATVASVDIPKLVQRKTDDKIHFKAITVQEAQALYVEEMKELDGLRKIIHQPCKEVLDCRLVAKRLRKLFEE